MRYEVGYKDEEGSFLLCNTFDTLKEAEYHREMWQDTEDQWHASGMSIYQPEDFHASFTIRIAPRNK